MNYKMFYEPRYASGEETTPQTHDADPSMIIFPPQPADSHQLTPLLKADAGGLA